MQTISCCTQCVTRSELVNFWNFFFFLLWLLTAFKFFLTYFQKPMRFYLLPTKDSFMGKAWGKTVVGSVGRALHRYRRGHGFKSRTVLNFFSGLISTTSSVVFLAARISYIRFFSAVHIVHRKTSVCPIFELVEETKHLMTGPKGNSKSCCPSTLNVPLRFASGKQNLLFPLGPVIKSLFLHKQIST